MTSQSVKHLPCKHENLSTTLWLHTRSQAVATAHIWNLNLQRQRQADSWSALSESMTSRSVKDRSQEENN